MEHIGHVRINRREVPYYLKDKKVYLIPKNNYTTLLPEDLKEKEVIKGITIGNREIAFVGCKYNNCNLAYNFLVVSECNTGLYSGITEFDRICFEGKAVNTFVGPGRSFDLEKNLGKLESSSTIIPKKWSDLNYKAKSKIRNDDILLSIDYKFWYNHIFSETSMGKAIPRFSLEYSKKKNIKSLPQIYFMVYDFFCFLNFRRNINFDRITLQVKDNDRFRTIATVYGNLNCDDDYDCNERNTIIFKDCYKYWGDLFNVVALRRMQKIYDNFYIPRNSKERVTISYEKYLSCALSFESEYERLYPSKKIENKVYSDVHNMYEKTADELNELFDEIRNGNITKEDFLQFYLYNVEFKYRNYVISLSKTKKKNVDGYCKKIKDALSKIDYSLAEKYKNAIKFNSECIYPIIVRLCNSNNIVFPEASAAGNIFANFRNEIAHGNPKEIESIHCVLYEVARALIYVMVLKKANADSESIKEIINKLF